MNFKKWLIEKAKEKQNLAYKAKSKINKCYYFGQWLAYTRALEEFEKGVNN